ncbi:MAG: sugar-binding protein [Promethearchaeota archaeon]
MQIQYNKYLILGILFSALLLPTIQPTSQALLMKSNFLSGSAPIIDGDPQVIEWASAYTNTFLCFKTTNPTVTLSVTLKAMNNENNLYLLLQWTDSTHNSNYDAIFIFFDEDNDNDYKTPANSENALMVSIVNTGTTLYQYYDGFWGISYSDDIGAQNGNASASWILSQYSIEIQVPLGASDIEDLQTEAGDLIGIAIIVADGTTGTTDSYEYPFDSWATFKGYSNPFQLAATTLIGTTTVPIAFLIIGLITLFTTWRNHRNKIPKLKGDS